MADNNRFDENRGPQQGNTSGKKDLGSRSDAANKSDNLQKNLHGADEWNENMEDDIRPADARDTRDADTKIGLINDPEADSSRTSRGEPRTGAQPTQHVKDKGNLGKPGSMREQLKSKEGFRSMDEDENTDDSLKGDNNETMGNP